MDARELKGMQIAATMPLRRDAKGWIVPSQSGPGTYRVVPAPTTTFKVAQGIASSPEGIQPWGCNCPDFELRNKPCKHVIAVELTVRRESVDVDGAIVTEELKVTYTQDWSAYNRAQCEEKERFLPMLADLCSTVPQPPASAKGGRPAAPMSDMAFTAVSKIYAGLSARRFDSDVRENTAKGLTAQDPHFNTVLKYLRSPKMTPVLRGLVELSALPLKAVEDDFAVDSTGFSTCRYVRWYDHKWGKEMTKREWVKLHAMCGVRTNVVTSVELSDWRSHDTNYFQPLVATTAANFTLREVSADKAYLSKANLQAVADAGGTPYIPIKGTAVGKVAAVRPIETVMAPGPEATAWTRMYHLFAYQRDTFLAHYHRRSNVETTFSMIKTKFGDSLRSKSDVGQMNEVLCKVVAHNLCVLIACIHEIGLDVPTFNVMA